MKILKLITLLLILSLGINYSLYSQKRSTVKIAGQVADVNSKPIQGVIIVVSFDEKNILQTSTESNGKYEITLDLQKTYFFEFSKQGFITQKYKVNTKIPASELDNFFDTKDCDVILTENFEGLNTKLFEKPFQSIVWDGVEALAFDDEYFNDKIKPQFNTHKKELEQLKKKKYDDLVAEGDALVTEKKYEDAMTQFQNAITIIPKEKVAKSKIDITKKQLSQTMSDDEAFSKSIEKGEQLLQSRNYEDAISCFEKAKLYKVEDPLPDQKIAKVENTKLKEYKEIKTKYDLEVQKADSLYKAQANEEAWLLYDNASKILPEESYPKQKIEQIKKLTTADNAYSKAIEKADKQFADKKFDVAEKCYQKASSFKPDEDYPKQKITECNKLIEAQANNDTKQKENEEKYKNAISSGNNLIKEKDYENAKAQFNFALTVKPDDKVATDKLKDIDNLIADEKTKQQTDLKKNYDKLIADGDKSLKVNDYDKAKDSYKKADLLIPGTSVPKQKIAQIEKLIKEKEDAEKLLAANKQANTTKTSDNNTVEKVSNNATKPIEKSVSANATTTQITQVAKSNNQLPETNNNKPKVDTVKKATLDNTNDSKIASQVPAIDMIKEYESRLVQARKLGNKELEASILSNIGNAYLDQNNLSKALEYFNESLANREKAGDKAGVSEIYNDIAITYYDSGKFQTTIDFYEKSLRLKEELNDKAGVKKVVKELASVNTNTFRYDKALEYYEKSLVLAEESKDKNEILNSTKDIGNLYYETKDLQKAAEYYEKTLVLSEDIKNDQDIASSLNNLGAIYYNLGDVKKSEDFYNQSLKAFENIGNKKMTSISLNNLGNINYDIKKYQNALDYYEKSLNIKKEIKYDKGVASSLHNIGNVYNKLDKPEKAIDYYTQSSDLALKISYNEMVAQNYQAISGVYGKMKDFKKAYEYSELYNKIQNSKIYDLTDKPITEFIGEDEFGSKDQQIENLKLEVRKQKILVQFESTQRTMEVELKNAELQKKEEEVAKQRILLYSFIIGFLLILAFSIMLYRLYIDKKKANVILALRNTEIEQQKEEIQAQRDEIEFQRDCVIEQRDTIALQNHDIKASISYARLLQNAILPPKNVMKELLPNHFIFYKPRDIVSGDFFWISKKENLTYFAVADCTGHGVPGAFMSMLGIASLNEIVNKGDKKPQASEVLDSLKGIIIESLHQTGEQNEAKDGMDISLTVIDFEKNNLQFSGAYNPLFLVRNGELNEYKADKMPIGIYNLKENTFANTSIDIQSNDMLYMFSDGFADQFGGKDGKKYKMAKFKEFLTNISNEDLEEQKKLLGDELSNWKMENEQVDDILVIGVRV